LKKLFLTFLLLLASAAASAQSNCTVNPNLCQPAPVPADCPTGKHWVMTGSLVAHCVAVDPPCAGIMQHDSLGNPTTCQAVVTSTSTQTQTIGCDPNYTGSQTQQRQVQQWSDGTTTYGNWSTTSSSCTYVPPTCSNGGTDWPTCTPPTCSNGGTNWPTCTPPTCSNGGTNYPTCTPPTCANGGTNYPTCTPPTCANGATNYPTCTLAAQPPAVTGAVSKVSSKHTSLGSGGDVATIVFKNSGTGTITGFGISCHTYSWHNYNQGSTGNGTANLAPGQQVTITCQAAASGSYSGSLQVTGGNMNTTELSF
jgi:hypothetical protein